MTYPYFWRFGIKMAKKQNTCIDCGKPITRYALRCHKCAAIERNKNQEYLKKQSLSQRGQKRSEEARHKMSIAQKKRFEDPKERAKCGRPNFGIANGNYIDGRTSLYDSIRHLKLAENWRKEVFERDNYTCQMCGQYGGQLEAHHIEALSILFDEFLRHYSQFSPIEDKETLVRLAMTYEVFWDIDNGITLCKKCHRSNYTTRPNYSKNK